MFEDEEEIPVENLMKHAENKYMNRVQKGVWMALSSEQEEIMELTAKIDHLNNEKQKRKGSNSSNKNSKAKRTRDEWKKLNEWKFVKPKKKDSDTITRENGKTYHWCPHHQMWTIHTAEKCDKKNEDSGHVDKRYKDSLHAMMEDQDSDEDSY